MVDKKIKDKSRNMIKRTDRSIEATNEGSEYIAKKSSKEDNNKMSDELDFDKIKGNKE